MRRGCCLHRLATSYQMALYSNRSSHNQIARLLKDACVAGGEKKKLLEGAGVSSAQLFPALESTFPIVLAESTTCLSTARGPKRICQLESCFYITPHNALRLSHSALATLASSALLRYTRSRPRRSAQMSAWLPLSSRTSLERHLLSEASPTATSNTSHRSPPPYFVFSPRSHIIFCSFILVTLSLY